MSFREKKRENHLEGPSVRYEVTSMSPRIRYWFHRSRRLLRWPFSRWARNSVTISEFIALAECDPTVRWHIDKARRDLRKEKGKTSDD